MPSEVISPPSTRFVISFVCVVGNENNILSEKEVVQRFTVYDDVFVAFFKLFEGVL